MFDLSASDSGVVSDEFWTLVGAPNDLSWALFHHKGAARVTW